MTLAPGPVLPDGRYWVRATVVSEQPVVLIQRRLTREKHKPGSHHGSHAHTHTHTNTMANVYCTRCVAHDWSECPFLHRQNGSFAPTAAIRRPARVTCPRGKRCKLGLDCPYVHSWAEYQAHPRASRPVLVNTHGREEGLGLRQSEGRLPTCERECEGVC